MFCLVPIHLQLLAQITDDFSDGDFSSSPIWTGITDKFMVSSNTLKLQAPAVDGIAYLATESQNIVNTTWEFWMKMDFNPSSTNYARIYLASDKTDLSGSLNGYFVMVGNTTDEVSLYRQTGTTRSRIIDGVDGRVNLASVVLKVTVTRNPEGEWQLFSDVGADGTFDLEGSVVDVTHTASSYFGVFCNYTSTRSDKFYFDDFVINSEPVPDSEAPTLQEVQVISSTKINLIFSEAIDESSIHALSNYVIDCSVGGPATISLQADQKTIELSFSKHFPNGVGCKITTSAIRDVAGNEMAIAEKNFLYFEPVPSKIKDIILTEIMADPSPPQELPEAEFVEIFNRSSHPFNLEGWKFTDGTRTAILPKYILLPQQYLTITSTSSAASLGHYGKVLGVSNFPSLNNSSDALVLKDGWDVVIDSVYYSDSWYKDSEKKDGGWSLEIIDVNNVCSEKENWVASENEMGGTPGKQNSVFANKPDVTGPMLLSVYPISTQSIRLNFNEKLGSVVPDKSDFKISPTVAITNVQFTNQNLTQLDVSFAETLQSRREYSVKIDNLRDCSGNVIQSSFNSRSFALPEMADSLDVLINEILFNPRPTGVDFVEVVNASPKFINLKNWSISNFTDGQPQNNKIISTEDLLLKPGAFLVFTKDGNVLKGEYIQSHDDNFLEVSLPAFNDSEGSVALLNEQGKIIDYLTYHEDMHSVFIKNEEGVSLERIALEAPTNETINWKSASSTVGYATPGYINSNSRERSELDDAIVVDPEVFIPVIGQPDFTQINYFFNKSGYVANVKIYDSNGRLIKHLASNVLLGSQGFLRWDGDRDDGSKARIGYYMIWFEVFDEMGKTITIRKRVALASRF